MIIRLPKGLTQPVKIGEGGFATVYRVRQTVLDRYVTIKIINEQDSSKRVEMLREGKIQAKLHMEHIPLIYDAFEWKKKVVIVMQWIKGISLFSFMKSNPEERISIVIADAFIRTLAKLHRLGYAHRDLKPENIVISPDDGIYFVDFAFARHVTDTKVSMAGVVKGTPGYIAPELWRGYDEVDYIRADLYSTGIILKRLLSGDRWNSIISLLTNIIPEKRPESGDALLELWKTEVTGICQPNWKEISGTLHAEQMTNKLNYSAKGLIQVHRYEEAYWLLVESLEYNPNNNETLALLNDVSQYPQKQKKQNSLTVAIITCSLVLLLLISFYFGRKSTSIMPLEKNPAILISEKTNKYLGSIKKLRAYDNIDLDFFTVPMDFNSLSGELYIVNYPSVGRLVIENENEYFPRDIEKGIKLTGGLYTLLWKSPNDRVVWREKITLLPFQKKIVNLPDTI